MKSKTQPESVRESEYTEASLPTVPGPLEQAIVDRTHAIAGIDLYAWERACANISDLLWCVQCSLEDKKINQAIDLAQNAKEIAVQTRKQMIDKATVFALSNRSE